MKPFVTQRPFDPTNPSHYRQPGKVECIDAMWEYFETEVVPKHFMHLAKLSSITTIVVVLMVGYCFGAAFKYNYRAGNKDGTPSDVDIRKGKWYMQMALHRLFPTSQLDPRDESWDGENKV